MGKPSWKGVDGVVDSFSTWMVYSLRQEKRLPLQREVKRERKVVYKLHVIYSHG